MQSGKKFPGLRRQLRFTSSNVHQVQSVHPSLAGKLPFDLRLCNISHSSDRLEELSSVVRRGADAEGLAVRGSWKARYVQEGLTSFYDHWGRPLPPKVAPPLPEPPSSAASIKGRKGSRRTINDRSEVKQFTHAVKAIKDVTVGSVRGRGLMQMAADVVECAPGSRFDFGWDMTVAEKGATERLEDAATGSRTTDNAKRRRVGGSSGSQGSTRGTGGTSPAISGSAVRGPSPRPAQMSKPHSNLPAYRPGCPLFLQQVRSPGPKPLRPPSSSRLVMPFHGGGVVGGPGARSGGHLLCACGYRTAGGCAVCAQKRSLGHVRGWQSDRVGQGGVLAHRLPACAPPLPYWVSSENSSPSGARIVQCLCGVRVAAVPAVGSKRTRSASSAGPSSCPVHDHASSKKGAKRLVRMMWSGSDHKLTYSFFPPGAAVQSPRAQLCMHLGRVPLAAPLPFGARSWWSPSHVAPFERRAFVRTMFSRAALRPQTEYMYALARNFVLQMGRREGHRSYVSLSQCLEVLDCDSTLLEDVIHLLSDARLLNPLVARSTVPLYDSGTLPNAEAHTLKARLPYKTTRSDYLSSRTLKPQSGGVPKVSFISPHSLPMRVDADRLYSQLPAALRSLLVSDEHAMASGFVDTVGSVSGGAGETREGVAGSLKGNWGAVDSGLYYLGPKPGGMAARRRASRVAARPVVTPAYVKTPAMSTPTPMQGVAATPSPMPPPPPPTPPLATPLATPLARTPVPTGSLATPAPVTPATPHVGVSVKMETPRLTPTVRTRPLPVRNNAAPSGVFSPHVHDSAKRGGGAFASVVLTPVNGYTQACQLVRDARIKDGLVSRVNKQMLAEWKQRFGDIRARKVIARQTAQKFGLGELTKEEATEPNVRLVDHSQVYNPMSSMDAKSLNMIEKENNTVAGQIIGQLRGSAGVVQALPADMTRGVAPAELSVRRFVGRGMTGWDVNRPQGAAARGDDEPYLGALCELPVTGLSHGDGEEQKEAGGNSASDPTLYSHDPAEYQRSLQSLEVGMQASVGQGAASGAGMFRPSYSNPVSGEEVTSPALVLAPGAGMQRVAGFLCTVCGAGGIDSRGFARASNLVMYRCRQFRRIRLCATCFADGRYPKLLCAGDFFRVSEVAQEADPSFLPGPTLNYAPLHYRWLEGVSQNDQEAGVGGRPRFSRANALPAELEPAVKGSWGVWSEPPVSVTRPLDPTDSEVSQLLEGMRNMLLLDNGTEEVPSHTVWDNRSAEPAYRPLTNAWSAAYDPVATSSATSPEGNGVLNPARLTYQLRQASMTWSNEETVRMLEVLHMFYLRRRRWERRRHKLAGTMMAVADKKDYDPVRRWFRALDWDLVASVVGRGRTAADCLLRFIQLPLVDPILDDLCVNLKPAPTRAIGSRLHETVGWTLAACESPVAATLALLHRSVSASAAAAAGRTGTAFLSAWENKQTDGDASQLSMDRPLPVNDRAFMARWVNAMVKGAAEHVVELLPRLQQRVQALSAAVLHYTLRRVEAKIRYYALLQEFMRTQYLVGANAVRSLRLLRYRCRNIAVSSHL